MSVKRAIVEEIHKPARRNFPRRRTVILGFDDLWQMDIAVFSSPFYTKENNGYKYILVVIDCYSKYLWTEALKTKSGEEVTGAMKRIFEKSSPRIPKNLQSDQGKEFFNKDFKKLMLKHSINQYTTFSTKKAAIAERVIRTLKRWMHKEFSFRGSYNWTGILDEITRKYNNRVHRTIKMKPKDVTSKTKLHYLNNDAVIHEQKTKFKVNDIVRISKYRAVFDKSYHPQFSTELFKIRKVHLTNPTTYLLQDLDGTNIEGGFYGQELQPTKHKDEYLVEKVLRRKGDLLLVRWLGFTQKHDSWIHKNDIL